MPLLQRYRDELCCFNDDIQGIAAVTLGTLIAASHAAGGQMRDHRVVFLGAGSAGCGIAEQIIAQMPAEGANEAEARAKVFMVDRFGLLTDEMPNLLDFQRKLAAKASRVTDAMLMAASQALADTSLLATTGQGPLLPQVNDIQKISRAIAVKVAKAAQKEGVAPLLSDEALEQALDDNWWQSAHRQYKHSSL